MREYFERALANIIKHGDTDIFPYPIETLIFFDKKQETIDLLLDLNKDLPRSLADYTPANHSALAPVGYTGFRWATQIDPIWNAYLLGLVISIADKIEDARLPKTENTVFSYRYAWDATTSDLFDKNYNWRSFMEHSLILAKKSKFVVVCDISEFYPRLNHHRLENSLKQLHLPGDQPSKIMRFLTDFSGTNSYGIPIGGPAARILSELLLNQIDRLLRSEGITFCRFADDYHLFANNYEQAFRGLLFLSEKLLNNQGLQLQKSKTRIMSGQEFVSTNPLTEDDDEDAADSKILAPRQLKPDAQAKNLLSFSIRFDPYSPTARDDYQTLRKETRSPMLRTDIILTMAKWRATYWLSDLKTNFRNLSPPERRAFIIASYVLTDEGSHWREFIKPKLSPLEILVRDWAAQKSQIKTWSVPI
jgi:Reverse transcriptase (RNA-dependent DNA polymerase)